MAPPETPTPTLPFQGEGAQTPAPDFRTEPYSTVLLPLKGKE